MLSYTMRRAMPVVQGDFDDGVRMGYEAGAVLLLEDHEALRRVISRVLAREGIAVVEAATVGDALAALRRTPMFDLLITDLGVPGRDDPGAMVEFEALSASRPTLFTSGYSREQAEQRFGLAPEAEFIEKPFLVQDLVDRVHRLLQSTGAW